MNFNIFTLQMPASMQTVETQLEEVPLDMQAYLDTEGHVYDFGFGLNCNGPIQDEHTKRFAFTKP